MDEIKLFDELKPAPLPDAARMHEAVRARLAAAASAPPAHPGRRRRTVVAVAAGVAMAAAGGTGYGLAAAQGGPGHSPGPAAGGGSAAPQDTVAGLAAVHGCPGEYITAGTLKQVSGTQLILQPANDHDHVNRDWRAKPVTVATTSSTKVTRPASGTVSAITDGSHVVVQGNWSGRKLAATEVGIEAALPSPNSFGPHFPGHPSGHVRKTPTPKGWLGPPFANGRVTHAHDGSFTMVTDDPILGAQRIHVITSKSTKVVARVPTSLSQIGLGANVVAVGQVGAHGVMTASTVAESSVVGILIAGGPAEVRSSGCSASAITDAALQAGG